MRTKNNLVRVRKGFGRRTGYGVGMGLATGGRVPLTLTLSRGEREQHLTTPLRTMVDSFADSRTSIPPLPWGEGRGEGERCLPFNPNGIAPQSPGLSRPAGLPWESWIKNLSTTTWLRLLLLATGDATPLGLIRSHAITQGSSCLATLGFGTESLWDSTPLLTNISSQGAIV